LLLYAMSGSSNSHDASNRWFSSTAAEPRVVN
jgi:hypothetical protein